jgi:5-methylcytosine-specific restriction endonuclease McrA
MKIDIFAAAEALSDQDLLAHIDRLAVRARNATTELVAHLAVLLGRPSVYAAKGYGSIFSYCTQALKLSEDAACNRIETAKACRRFPVLFDHLESGAMTLSSIRLLGRHLTKENHEAAIERAKGCTLSQIKVLIVEIAPKPDAPTSMCKLPKQPSMAETGEATPTVLTGGVSETRAANPADPPPDFAAAAPTASSPAPAKMKRAIIEPTSPHRYRLQFTIDQETHDRLRRVQALLAREIPGGDPAAIFERALKMLEAHVEKTKLAHLSRPQRQPQPEAPSTRSATDNSGGTPTSRHIPHETRRTVWKRDGARCAFVSPEGRRCTERKFLEFHHVWPYARQGPATVDNIALRCRRHNQYEAEMFFGTNRAYVIGGDSIRTPPRGC